MATKEFQMFKASGFPLKEIRRQGLTNNGEHTPLDSVQVGRFRGSFGKCYQYKVVSHNSQRWETAIPQVKRGALDITDSNSIHYKVSEIPECAVGMWV